MVEAWFAANGQDLVREMDIMYHVKWLIKEWSTTANGWSIPCWTS